MWQQLLHNMFVGGWPQRTNYSERVRLWCSTTCSCSGVWLLLTSDPHMAADLTRLNDSFSCMTWRQTTRQYHSEPSYTACRLQRLSSNTYIRKAFSNVWTVELMERQILLFQTWFAVWWFEVWSGTPQASVIGSLLFLLVNKLPEWVNSGIKMFSDDIKLWTKITKLEDSSQLQNDINRLVEWSKESLLGFNVIKSKVIHIGHCHDIIPVIKWSKMI